MKIRGHRQGGVAWRLERMNVIEERWAMDRGKDNLEMISC